jgi:hypothetical protein
MARSSSGRTLDFSNARRNPYAKRINRSVTIRMDRETVEYFERMGAKTQVPFRSLIGLYLRDCALRARALPGMRSRTSASKRDR